MSDRNEEPLYEGRLSGTTFENRQEILAALKTSADRTTIGVLRESVEYDGIECLLCRHKQKDIEPPISLGWIPAQPKNKDNSPGPDAPLTLLRAELDRRSLAPDDHGIYVDVVFHIEDVPRGGRTYGIVVSVWSVSAPEEGR